MRLINWLNKHPILSYWMPALVVVIIISFFSLLANPFSAVGVPKGDLLDFNFLHIFAYFVLSFLVGTALRHSDDLNKHQYLTAILFTLVFSVYMEIGQYFVPDRFFSVIDLGYNLIGILLAQLTRFVLKKNKNLNKII